MKKNWMFLLITVLISSSSIGQGKKVYDEGYIIKVGDKAPDFTIKEAGITRNVIIDRSGKIIFLTRLYEREEFDQMKKVIFTELAAK